MFPILLFNYAPSFVDKGRQAESYFKKNTCKHSSATRQSQVPTRPPTAEPTLPLTVPSAELSVVTGLVYSCAD